MQPPQEDLNSSFKLAQLWHLSCNSIRTSSNSHTYKTIIHELLKDDVDINCKVTVDTLKVSSKYKTHLKNCTTLHFAYCAFRDIDAFNILLERGADFTAKNENGQTALHFIATQCFEYGYFITSDSPFINAVLSAHVKTRNFTNPRDDNGLSHLHAACIANHVEALELFLDNGASADEAVNFDAPKYVRYTPLHFAVKFNKFEVAQVLLERGANVDAKNAKGMTPLDLAVEYRLHGLNDASGLCANYCGGITRFTSDASSNSEKIIRLLLDKQASFSVGWSHLHVACTLSDLSIAEKLLNQAEDIDRAVMVKESFCPRYTPLHLAAINSVDAVKMLLTHGAKLEVGDDKGLTGLDICTDNFNVQEIHDVLCCIDTSKEILMSDGQTKLLDFVQAVKDLDQFRLFLQNNDKNLAVPNDSPLWPGCTILHLAVILATKPNRQRRIYDDAIVRECLQNDPNVNSQDTRGRTPLHLAFYQRKNDIVRLLIERVNRPDAVPNLIDEDDLSYLHIAYATRNEALIEKLLRNADVNVAYKGKRTLKFVAPGSTPLHVVAANGTRAMLETLLNRGANLHATDEEGFAPIHYLLRYPGNEDGRPIGNLLLDSLLESPKDVVVEGVGLSYLHVACHLGHARAIEKWLELGADVNAAIDFEKLELPKRKLQYSGYTPLQLAPRANEEVTKSLIRRGADVFAEVPERLRYLYDGHVLLANKHVTRCLMGMLMDDDDMQKSMEERLGLTRLHVACYLKNEEAIRKILEGEVDVNAQVHADSVIFAGYTPLHLLVIVHPPAAGLGDATFAIDAIIRLLVDHGADGTIRTVKKETPVYLFWESQNYFADKERCKNLLLNAQPNFNVNPENAYGMSHFDFACLWHQSDVVEKFLQAGSVDLTRMTDYFVTQYHGSTPLHLSLHHVDANAEAGKWEKVAQTVDLLLKYSADVAAKDVYGETPLHKVAVLKSPEMSILDKLVRYTHFIESLFYISTKNSV